MDNLNNSTNTWNSISGNKKLQKMSSKFIKNQESLNQNSFGQIMIGFLPLFRRKIKKNRKKEKITEIV